MSTEYRDLCPTCGGLPTDWHEPSEITIVTYSKGEHDDRDQGNVTFYIDPLKAKDLANALTKELEQLSEQVCEWYREHAEPEIISDSYDEWYVELQAEQLRILRSASVDMRQVLQLHDFRFDRINHIEFYLETLGKGTIG